jgi:hypothetical protein
MCGMLCDWISYPTMTAETFDAAEWSSGSSWTEISAGGAANCPKLEIRLTGETNSAYEALSSTVTDWTDGYTANMKITLDSSSLPEAAGEIAYCFGVDMTASEAPNGAYCYIIETAEDSGVFSTVGTNVPKLVFITSDNWGSGSVVTTEITGDKYDIYSSTTDLAAADADVFVDAAYF